MLEGRKKTATAVSCWLITMCLCLPLVAKAQVSPQALLLAKTGPPKETLFKPTSADLRPGDMPRVRVAQRRLFSLPRVLKIRVVDTEGNPVEGATIDGHQIKATRRFESKGFKVRGLTDAAGEYSMTITKPQVSFSVYKSGYYADHSYIFKRAEVPRGELLVTFVRKLKPVHMYKSNISTSFHGWREDADSYEIGLRFSGGAGPSDDGQWTEKKDEADLWFIAQKMEEIILEKYGRHRNNSKWTLTLKGMRGWEIKSGPVGSEVGIVIHEAPTDGYEKQASFKGPEKDSLSFYLRFNGGERYGKLTGFTFRDSSNIEHFLTRISHIDKSSYDCGSAFTPMNRGRSRSLTPKHGRIQWVKRKRPLYASNLSAV